MILDRFRLDGKVALVTGGGRGIGKAMARALVEAGANAVLVSRTLEELQRAKEEISEHGRVEIIQADLSQTVNIDFVVNRALEMFGRLDVLVNAAGTLARSPAEELGEEDWDRVLALNLRSVFLLSQRVARVMIRQGGGRIINVASLLSEIGVPFSHIVAYAASKGGIRSLTKQLAVEWAKYNINVNAVGPGYIRTQLNRALWSDPERSKMVLDKLAIKRWGETEDLMGATVFLASDASSYVTGQIVWVDGGYLSA